MTSTFGLPRYVANFLRHMETHKDCLKWNITETSHKIHLTLTWNFRKQKGKETLWDKLQRTLKFSRSMDEGSSNIPHDLSQFLEASPKRGLQQQQQQQQQQQEQRQNQQQPEPDQQKQKHTKPPLQRQMTWNGPFRRPFNWSRYSSYSLPGRTPTGRHTLRHSHSLQESPSHLRHVSPSRYSFSDDLIRADSIGDTGPRHSTPLTSTPNLTRSNSSTCSPNVPSRIRLSYRTTEDIDRSMEDILVRTRERTKVKLENIRREWNRTIRDWPQVVDQEAAMSMPASVVNLSSDSTESDPSLQVGHTTVQKCLRSCDNILFRHSTDIT